VSALGRHHSVSPARTTLLACSWPLPSHALGPNYRAPLKCLGSGAATMTDVGFADGSDTVQHLLRELRMFAAERAAHIGR
jgi:hypothetical protein